MEIVDSQKAFEQCFISDTERENYMYMYSNGNEHYFKHIDTREYVKIQKMIV